jgi:hypothetical protein
MEIGGPNLRACAVGWPRHVPAMLHTLLSAEAEEGEGLVLVPVLPVVALLAAATALIESDHSNTAKCMSGYQRAARELTTTGYDQRLYTLYDRAVVAQQQPAIDVRAQAAIGCRRQQQLYTTIYPHARAARRRRTSQLTTARRPGGLHAGPLGGIAAGSFGRKLHIEFHTGS